MSGADQSIRILHVDDDSDLAELVGTFLEREGEQFDVRTATSAEAGLEQLEAEPVDCVVSDYDMPGKTGIDFLEAVRERRSDLPFILYTGKGSEEIASEAISAGVTDYLQKESGSEHYVLLANRIENAVAQTRAERQIERTRDYFGTILEYASDYVMIVDETGAVDYVSPAVERVMGYTPQELTGMDAFDTVHPEDRTAAAERFAAVLESTGGEETVELRARHADGTWRWLEVRAKKVRDEDVVEGIIVSVRDVTERASSRMELDTVVDNLPGYVYRHRYEEGWPLEFVKGSAEAITGYTASELAEVLVEAEEIIHPEDREAVRTGVEEGLEESGYYDLTYRIIAKDGEVRWIRDQGQLVTDPTSSEEMLDGLIVDVTERKEHEQELELFRRLIDHTTDSLLVIDPDTGAFLDANETACRRRGYTRQELLDRSVPEVEEDIPDLDSWLAMVADLKAGTDITFEGTHRRKDGSTFPVEVRGSYLALDDDYVVAISRDLSDRSGGDERGSTDTESPG